MTMLTRALVALCIAMPTAASAIELIGINYNWDFQQNNTCPTPETLTAFMPAYAQQRATVVQQLAQMRANGLTDIRVFTGWGDDTGVTIEVTSPERTSFHPKPTRLRAISIT